MDQLAQRLRQIQLEGYHRVNRLGDLIEAGKLVEAGLTKNEWFAALDEIGEIQKAMTFPCPTTSTVVVEPPVCDTVFDCASSEAAFTFNNGVLTGLQCGQQVPVSLLWQGCDGNRAPDAPGGGVGLSVDVGSEVFNGAIGNTNTYIYTLPSTSGPHSATFTWGNSNDPALCSVTIDFDCTAVEPSVLHTDILVTGYGTESNFGNDGRTIEVNNLLDDSNPGSFRYALEQTGARKIVFNVEGIAPVESVIELGGGQVSALGSTALGTGFGVQATREYTGGPVMRTRQEDLLFENIGFFQNTPISGQNVDNRDVLSITTGSRRVCFCQCTFAWGSDENIQIWDNSSASISDVTFLYCLIAEALNDVGHSAGDHSKGMLIGRNSSRFSIHHNWFTRNKDRNPQVYADLAQVVNNIIIAGGGTSTGNANHIFRAGSIGSNQSTVQRHDIVSNRTYGNAGFDLGTMIAVPSPVILNNPLMPVYASGNIGGNRTSNAQPENAWFTQFGAAAPLVLQGAPQTAPNVLTIADVTTNALRDDVYAKAGAFSWNRRAVEQRLINIAPDYATFADFALEGNLF